MNATIANETDVIRAMQADTELQKLREQLLLKVVQYRYSYNFSWCGRPVIQFPDDVLTLQEIVWKERPQLIVETGVAHGGSLVFYASLLEAMGGPARVAGVDIHIRPHNRRAIEEHPLAHRITLIEGSSVGEEALGHVRALAAGLDRVLVVLDSNHTHEHVLKELELYSPLVKKGGHLVVLDTVIEDMPAECFPDRPWGPGDNPKTAVHQFLKSNDRFQIDADLQSRLLMTAAPDGYLLCVKD